VRRAATRPAAMVAGELLLDQGVLAGLGNVYRCEALFLQGLDPATPRRSLAQEQLRLLITGARELIRANAGPGTTFRRDTGLGPERSFVYGRSGRPCRRCGTTIRSVPLGAQARTVYWCPSCQRGDRPA